jgi:hypothetical protein
LFVETAGKKALNDFANMPVKLAAVLDEDGLVGGFLGEGMANEEFEFGRGRGLLDEVYPF